MHRRYLRKKGLFVIQKMWVVRKSFSTFSVSIKSSLGHITTSQDAILGGEDNSEERLPFQPEEELDRILEARAKYRE